MAARIIHDVDGTTLTNLEAEHISAQMWLDSSRYVRGAQALIKLSNGGRVTRTVQLSFVWSIDIEHV